MQLTLLAQFSKVNIANFKRQYDEPARHGHLHKLCGHHQNTAIELLPPYVLVLGAGGTIFRKFGFERYQLLGRRHGFDRTQLDDLGGMLCVKIPLS